MIPNLNSAIAILIYATPILILFFFLPALVELKKPKDCGPRIIDNIPLAHLLTESVFSFADIEEKLPVAGLRLRSFAKIIEFLPNLEV
jgi:hypothetical protein